MALNGRGFSVVEIPATVGNLAAAFEELPADPYCPNRFRRFSQFRVYHDDTQWQAERLEHRPLIQPRRFNSYVGGVLRHLQPLIIDVTPILSIAADSIPLDPSSDWHFDVHQWRTACHDTDEAISVPEGPHQDGHEFGAIVMMDRRAVTGGQTLLYPVESNQPFFTTTLHSKQILLFDDKRMRHFTTNIRAAGPTGVRDIFVFNINCWNNRKYGAAFEASAVG